MSFFEADLHGFVNVNGGYVQGKRDPGALELLKNSIGLLARATASARTRSGPDDAMAQKAFRCVIGFGMLGISEGQACLLLISAGLDRSARVHLRSLYGYNVRAQLVSDPNVAANFLAAAAYEIRELGEAMGFDEATIKSAVRDFALPPDIKPGKETAALGGTMKKIIERKSGPSDYAAFFARPSQISHGSILALHEVARAVAGKGSDFPDFVSSDGQGDAGLLQAAVHIHELIATIREACDIGSVAAPLIDLLERVQSIRDRLGHSIPSGSGTNRRPS